MKNLAARLEIVLGCVSAVVLFLMMMVTAVDVIGRYLFNTPLAGGFELTEMMLAALGCAWPPNPTVPSAMNPAPPGCRFAC